MANRACSGLDGVIAAPVGKRNDVVLSHHKVVEHSHVYHLEQILETSGNSLVGIRGVDHAGGVVVGQYDRCGVSVEGRLDHLTG